MKGKQKQPEPPPMDSGAPAALARWAEQERIEAATVVKLSKDHENLLQLDRDDQEIESQIRRTAADLAAAKEQWAQTSKILLSFDKNVAAERREGEKILVSEAAEIFAQFELSLRLAMEAYINAISQQAALCSSPEEFYQSHADTIRATRAGAVEAAKKDGVLPSWLN